MPLIDFFTMYSMVPKDANKYKRYGLYNSRVAEGRFKRYRRPRKGRSKLLGRAMDKGGRRSRPLSLATHRRAVNALTRNKNNATKSHATRNAAAVLYGNLTY